MVFAAPPGLAATLITPREHIVCLVILLIFLAVCMYLVDWSVVDAWVPPGSIVKIFGFTGRVVLGLVLL